MFYAIKLLLVNTYFYVSLSLIIKCPLSLRSSFIQTLGEDLITYFLPVLLFAASWHSKWFYTGWIKVTRAMFESLILKLTKIKIIRFCEY